jgi:hypothetical protein
MNGTAAALRHRLSAFAQYLLFSRWRSQQNSTGGAAAALSHRRTGISSENTGISHQNAGRRSDILASLPLGEIFGSFPSGPRRNR